MAIVSNKPDFAVKSLCAELFPGIPAWGEQPGIPRKPEPDMLRHAMDALGAESCIYIGDSEVDVQTAKNAAGNKRHEAQNRPLQSCSDYSTFQE